MGTQIHCSKEGQQQPRHDDDHHRTGTSLVFPTTQPLIITFISFKMSQLISSMTSGYQTVYTSVFFSCFCCTSTSTHKAQTKMLQSWCQYAEWDCDMIQVCVMVIILLWTWLLWFINRWLTSSIPAVTRLVNRWVNMKVSIISSAVSVENMENVKTSWLGFFHRHCH